MRNTKWGRAASRARPHCLRLASEDNGRSGTTCACRQCSAMCAGVTDERSKRMQSEDRVSSGIPTRHGTAPVLFAGSWLATSPPLREYVPSQCQAAFPKRDRRLARSVECSFDGKADEPHGHRGPVALHSMPSHRVLRLISLRPAATRGKVATWERKGILAVMFVHA